MHRRLKCKVIFVRALRLQLAQNASIKVHNFFWVKSAKKIVKFVDEVLKRASL